ncbi:MAG: hypothetical protein Q7U04_03390, partial [Bacteriovorax sp.]|nr:hypothetical protein [Bacteriovorax sp.]
MTHSEILFKRQVLQTYIQEKDEVTFMKEVLIPLFDNMGFRASKFNHGSGEFGKDFVLEKSDDFGETKFIVVVVKNGDIKNTNQKEKDNLAEVMRQVGQCWRLPIENTSGVKKLPSEVKVVISGTLTKGSEKEIIDSVESYNKSNTSFITQDILIELLNKFYPTIFEYNLPTLAQYLQNLSGSIIKRTTLDEDSKLINFLNLKCYRNIESLETKKLKHEDADILSLIKVNSNVWLQGGTGSGKTYAVYQAIQKALAQITKKNKAKEIHNDNEILIPLYVRSYLLENITVENIESLIREVLKNGNLKVTDDLVNYLLNSNLLFVIDEFEKNPNVTKINSVVRIIKAHNPSNSVFLLSRQMEDSSFDFDLPFTVWRLKDINLSYAVKTVEQSIPSENGFQKAKLKELIQNGVLDRMPRTPLALNILKFVFADNIQNTPNNICEFFDLFFQIVLGRWEKKRDTLNLFDYNQVSSFFKSAAFKMVEENKITIEVEELFPIAQRVIDSVNDKVTTPQMFIKKISELGDIITIQNGCFEFVHRTYLEFLAGSYYSMYRWNNDFVLENIVELNWEDTLIFASGFKKMDDELLKSVRKIPSITTRHKFLKMKNISLLMQALYQSDIMSRKDALSAGIEAGIDLRDDEGFSNGMRHYFPDFGEISISYLNLYFFKSFYGRSSFSSVLLSNLANSENLRGKAYALAALSGVSLKKVDQAELDVAINKMSFDKSVSEHLAISHFMRQEEKDINKELEMGNEQVKIGIANTLKNILNSKKFKDIAKKTQALLIE